MRTRLEFRSSELSDPVSDEGTRRDQTLARFLENELPKHGFSVTNVFAEDWGWRVEVANDTFPLWVGCGHYEEWGDGFLCFIEPRKSYVRRWLKRFSTVATVEHLAMSLERVVQESAKARDLRWWTEEENARV